MRRLVTIITISGSLALALLAADAGFALTTNGFHGTTEAGGLIAFGAKFDKKGDPVRVQDVRWANVPVSCAGSPFQHSGDLKHLTMRVDNDGRFHGSDKLGDAKVAVGGRFTHHDTRATGTFRLHGVIPGCSDADTGKLNWEMTKKH